MYACFKGRVPVIQFLIGAGADLDAKDNKGKDLYTITKKGYLCAKADRRDNKAFGLRR